MVNEQATDKLIKELIAEKERLLQELERAKSGSSFKGYSEEGLSTITVCMCMYECMYLRIYIAPFGELHVCI